jgi:serine/threonine-protein kinase
VLLGIAAVLVPIVGIWVWTIVRPKQVKLVQRPGAEPEPSASAIELSEVPVTGGSEQPLGNKLASCVAGYLPKGSFGKAPEVEWLCTETDPRVGGEKLHGAVVTGAAKGPPTDAMKIFARIGWYDMAAFAVVRAGCCFDAKPIALPDAKAECAMDAALRDLGKTVVDGENLEEPLKKYTDSIHCELNRGGGRGLRRTGRPVGGEDTAFRDLVKKLD